MHKKEREAPTDTLCPVFVVFPIRAFIGGVYLVASPQQDNKNKTKTLALTRSSVLFRIGICAHSYTKRFSFLSFTSKNIRVFTPIRMGIAFSRLGDPCQRHSSVSTKTERHRACLYYDFSLYNLWSRYSYEAIFHYRLQCCIVGWIYRYSLPSF